LAWLADERHQAAHGHNDQIAALVVAVGSRLAKWRNRDNDQSRILLANPLMVERTGRKRFDHEVRTPGQLLEHVDASRCFHVQRDRSFAGVVTGEVEAIDAARGVASRRLHFDDVRAKIREDFPARETTLVSKVKYAIRS